MCGPLVYTIDITSPNLPGGPYNDVFSVQMHDGTKLKPTQVSVNTENQEYALRDGRVNKSWRTEFFFKVEAQFTKHPEQGVFVMPEQSFFIRDYCAAM